MKRLSVKDILHILSRILTMPIPSDEILTRANYTECRSYSKKQVSILTEKIIQDNQ